MKIISSFKERLNYAMKLRGINQSQLSKASGVSKPLICNYLRGEYKANNLNLTNLAKVLKVNPLWLMGYDENMEPQPVTNPSNSNNDLISEIVDLCNEQNRDTLEKIIKIIKTII